MTTKIFYTCLLGLLLMKADCISTDPDMNEEILLTIYHYKVPCVGENIQLCYRLRYNGSEPQFFYDKIEGFNYVWGYNYTISVEKIPVNSPKADASSFRYQLKKIIRKDKVSPDETFELPLKKEDQSLLESKKGTCYYFSGIEIQTGKYSCQELAKAQSAIFLHNREKPGLALVKLK
jgi:hypothetical protein